MGVEGWKERKVSEKKSNGPLWSAKKGKKDKCF